MAAEYLSPGGLTIVLTRIKTLLGGYQPTETGKGLSTNDYTTADKDKLAGINGLADLTDDATHRVVTDTEKATWNAKQAALVFNTTYNASTNKVATMTDVQNAVSAITGIKFEKVEVLPATGVVGTIYLVPKTPAATNNVYTEYYWDATNSAWEKLGDTTIDLSNYLQKTDIDAISAEEISDIFDAVGM